VCCIRFKIFQLSISLIVVSGLLSARNEDAQKRTGSQGYKQNDSNAHRHIGPRHAKRASKSIFKDKSSTLTAYICLIILVNICIFWDQQNISIPIVL
jgi:hypothetical protein